MGTKARSIVKFPIKELIDLLNQALADEWLAYYQYWIGAFVVKGIESTDAEEEMKEHANDELKHAGMLAKRIIQLGGTPLLSPDEWMKKSSCGYEAPKDFHIKKILEQNIKGEQCAISVYEKLISKIHDQDVVTHHLLLEILKEEIEHEEDLEKLLEDLSY